jgi:hypothetical protein
MELALSPEEEKMRTQAQQLQSVQPAQFGPLAPREKGIGEQMGDKVKNEAMNEGMNLGKEAAQPYMQAAKNAINPMGSAGAGAVAGQAATNAALASTPATMGMAGAELGALASTGAGAGAAGAAGAGTMAALGTAMPYVGAALLADQALGLGITDKLGKMFFSNGGEVGPLSPQYNAQGTMSREQAMALMNNQPEPMPMPMMRPDPRELMTEIKQEMVMPQPRPRPESINPYDAAMNYEGYDPILPAPTNLPQYRAGGGPLGMGLLSAYHDMMKKNMR